MASLPHERPAPAALRLAAASSEVLEAVFEGCGVGLCLVDSRGRVRRANARWLESFGLAAPEVRGRVLWELLSDSPPELRALHARAREGEAVALPEHRIVRGYRESWYVGRLAPVPLPDGTGVLVSVWDVTAAKRLERDLRAKADLLHLAHDAIFTWSFQRGIESWNVGAEELYGYRADEAMGMPTPALLKTVFPVPWSELEGALRAGGLWIGELLHTRKDGRVLTVAAKLQLVRGEDGTERVLEATHDITERKEARERAEWLARFPRENPDPVMRIARDGTVLYANEAATRFLGMTPGADVTGRLADLVTFALEGGDRVRAELEHGGAVFAANLVATGDEVNLYAQDVTARKAAEDALREANERLREVDRRKDEFLAMLSHELRNPLAPIRNAIAILEHASPAGTQATRAKAVIRRQVDHMARLVGDLLDVARIARGKIEIEQKPMDLVALVQRSAEDHRTLMYERGISLSVELPVRSAWVHGDATRLTQVVGNLLQNAAKFTERGGRVTVSVESAAGFAVVRVRDSGVGMSPELLARIFEPFVQADRSLARSQGGLGLGLALVKGLVQLHGGEVHAESPGPGMGACFVVRLPAVDPVRTDDERPAAAVPVRSRRVLVVDDNRDGAESLSAMLGLIGHEVEVAFDGPSALEKARVYAPEVVLCDLGLPGMSGYEVARRLRELRPDGMRLVAVSGYAAPEDVEESRRAGFDAHLAKPPDLSALALLIAR
jgi:PAS domain S-box-containing protein